MPSLTRTPMSRRGFALRRLLVGVMALACISWFAAILADAAGPPWPMYGGNPQHTGYVPVTLDPSRFSLRWQQQSFAIDGAYFPSTVVAAEGKAFGVWYPRVGDAHLAAIDAATGALIWDRALGNGASASPPSYAYGKVYLVAIDGTHWLRPGEISLRAYDATTGELIFRTPHATTAGSPTVENGIVYLPYEQGLAAIDAFDGSVLWSTPLAGSPPGSNWTPAVNGTRAYGYLGRYRGVGPNGLYAIGALSGALAFTIPDPELETSFHSYSVSPVLGDADDVLVLIGNDRLMRFDLGARRIRWQVKDSFWGAPSVAGGVVYAINDNACSDVASCGHSLDARDEITGARRWKWRLPRGVATSIEDLVIQAVIVTDSHVLVSTSRSTYAIDLFTQRIAWSFPVGGGLALADGTLYIAGDWLGRRLAAIDTMTPITEPALDIRVNGVAGATTVRQGQPISVTVSLDPRARSGQRADWWVSARARSTVHTHWLTSDRGWVQSFSPLRAYDGALVAVSGYEALPPTSLPPGRYDFMFAVDVFGGVMTGTYFDTAMVTVQ